MNMMLLSIGFILTITAIVLTTTKNKTERILLFIELILLSASIVFIANEV